MQYGDTTAAAVAKVNLEGYSVYEVRARHVCSYDYVYFYFYFFFPAFLNSFFLFSSTK